MATERKPEFSVAMIGKYGKDYFINYCGGMVFNRMVYFSRGDNYQSFADAFAAIEDGVLLTDMQASVEPIKKKGYVVIDGTKLPVRFTQGGKVI